MATASIEKQPPAVTESRSAKKKKAKAETEHAATNGLSVNAVIPNDAGKDESSNDNVKADADATHEHPYLRELAKQIRNINKKLSGLQKTDAVVAENPGVSLDDLVATKKINADQKASLLKKPQLKEQLEALENQIQHYRQFQSDSQTRLSKQKEELLAQNASALEAAKEAAKLEAVNESAAELRRKLLIFSQFLRCAAHKRTVEDDAETSENRAFEGALLLVYGGDQKAVDTAINIIEGSDDHVPTIEGTELPITYSQIKKASIDHAPYQAEETWVDQVAEATSAAHVEPVASDPTVAHAGLTEIGAEANGINVPQTAATSSAVDAVGTTGNTAGEQWGTAVPGTEANNLDESFEMVPRPQEELEVPAPAALPVAHEGKTSWADESAAAHDSAAVPDTAAAPGNAAGERWDRNAAGSVVEAPAEGDGFHQVPGRQRGGRGGRGGEFRGADFRGRGRGRGGYRGDGEFRGRGRGGFRGNRGDGEFRGRGGGRGRGGPRGGGESQTPRGASD